MNGICHHPDVNLMALLGEQSSYVLAGALTVVAAGVVTLVILISSRSDRSG